MTGMEWISKVIKNVGGIILWIMFVDLVCNITKEKVMFKCPFYECATLKQ